MHYIFTLASDCDIPIRTYKLLHRRLRQQLQRGGGGRSSRNYFLWVTTATHGCSCFLNVSFVLKQN